MEKRRAEALFAERLKRTERYNEVKARIKVVARTLEEAGFVNVEHDDSQAILPIAGEWYTVKPLGWAPEVVDEST